MTSRIYCIEGSIRGDFETPGSIERRWSVCYRVDPDDAKTIKQACERQRDEFVAAVQAIDDRRLPEPRAPGRRASSHDIGTYKIAKEEWCERNRELDAAEAALVERWSKDLLDPLLPIYDGSEGLVSLLSMKVVYEIVEFWDDPREMGEAALMRLRAQLHAPTEIHYEDDD